MPLEAHICIILYIGNRQIKTTLRERCSILNNAEIFAQSNINKLQAPSSFPQGLKH